MSHWFDRLATWSTEGRDDGEERLLTRRQAVRAAAAGAGTIGLLGSPLLGKALAEPAGCDCARKVDDQAHRTLNKLTDKLILNPLTLVSPLGVATWLVAGTGLYAGALTSQLVHCGVVGSNCDGLPSGKPPPPDKQPCTQRGGVRLRGDQCGGGGGGATGGSGCAGGTSSCPVPGGGDLCCFGTDMCCSGCCCVAEVGCSCCG